MNLKIVRKARQKNRLHHYRSQIVALKAQNSALTAEAAEAKDQRGIVVGPFFMVRLPSGNLFVDNESGEGGGFEEGDLLPYLRQFWREKF